MNLWSLQLARKGIGGRVRTSDRSQEMLLEMRFARFRGWKLLFAPIAHGSVENFVKNSTGNYYWRYTHFSLNHDDEDTGNSVLFRSTVRNLPSVHSIAPSHFPLLGTF